MKNQLKPLSENSILPQYGLSVIEPGRTRPSIRTSLQKSAGSLRRMGQEDRGKNTRLGIDDLVPLKANIHVIGVSVHL